VINLVFECHELLKDCGFLYAVCGGYALELFIKKKIRSHSDIDVSIFEEDRQKIVGFLIGKGWNVYEHKYDWVDNKKSDSFLRKIVDTNDEGLKSINQVWAIKPDCSFIDVRLRHDECYIYDYEITNTEQLNFDYIGVSFNKCENGSFVFDSFNSQGKYISRELDKAVLYTDDGIPYLAPEVNLFMNSHPAYLESEYHRVKSVLDFDIVAPMLQIESRKWFMNALETAYPDGLERLSYLRGLKSSV